MPEPVVTAGMFRPHPFLFLHYYKQPRRALYLATSVELTEPDRLYSGQPGHFDQVQGRG